MCGTFDDHGVNLSTVEAIGDYLKDKGSSAAVAAEMLFMSVDTWCPEYSEPLRALGQGLWDQKHPLIRQP